MRTKITTNNKGMTKSRSLKQSNAIQCYILLALPIIGFLVFTIYPILWTFRWSFFYYNQVPSQTRFIGLDNFITMFTKDFTYWKCWGNTLLFALCKIPVEIPLAMILALILNTKIRGSNFFRSVYYLPNVISVAIIGLIFSNIFGFFGIINETAMKIGILSENINWFETKAGAYAVLVIASVWNSFGVNTMYLLAALTNVPEEIYESAALDGASRATTFFKITLPMIAPVFQTILLLSIVGTLGVNDLILVLTGGAPGGQTFTVMSYLTKKFVPGFADNTSSLALGYGCAMSVCTTILFAVIALLYNKFSKKMSNLY